MSNETIGCNLRIKLPEAWSVEVGSSVGVGAEARVDQWTPEELLHTSAGSASILTLQEITRRLCQAALERDVALVLAPNPFVDLFSQGYVAPPITYRSRLRGFANETKRRARNTWLALCGHNLED
ncbi:MAG: hypothetical protein P4L76_17790 [Beijerinckiaceae bacterium]|nr:hypothetical protein [Beijerinckiaceae bacterium]